MQEWHFPFSLGWCKGASSGAVDFCISLFYIHFYTYKLVDVQCCSYEQQCMKTGRQKCPSFHVYTESEQANKLGINQILSWMCCRRRKYYCYVRALRGSYHTLKMVGQQKQINWSLCSYSLCYTCSAYEWKAWVPALTILVPFLHLNTTLSGLSAF